MRVLSIFLFVFFIAPQFSFAQHTATLDALQTQIQTLTKQVNSHEEALNVSEKEPEDKQMGEIGNVLLLFLALSLVFETALTPIFNWRIFLRHFEGKGVKTPLTVILALCTFYPLDLDIFSDIVAIFKPNDAQNVYGGKIITALLIAGGSDGIFRIFTKLGIRNPEERKIKAKEERA